MKILVPVIHLSASSDAAYRICDFANSMGADVFVLFVVPKLDAKSYWQGELAIEIFEEAVQNYEVSVNGYVVAGNAIEAIEKALADEQVDLIVLGSKSEEENDWHRFSKELNANASVTCDVQFLEDDLMVDSSIAHNG